MVESAKRKFAATEKCENCKVLIKELRVKQQTLTHICSDGCQDELHFFFCTSLQSKFSTAIGRMQKIYAQFHFSALCKLIMR